MSLHYLQAFLMSAYFSTIKILVSVYPRRSALMRLLAFVVECELAAGQARILFIFMYSFNNISNADMLSCCGTSIHETDIRSFNSNSLRSYNIVTGVRHRKPKTTSEIRQKICSYFLDTFPEIRKVKVIDTGKIFSARIWFRSGRTFCEKAYSIRNLFRLLNEKVCSILLDV